MSSRASGEMEHVEYVDALGRKVLFMLSGAGNVDVYVDEKLKVQRLRDVRFVGPAVHFDGKRLMFTERALVVPEPSGPILDRLATMFGKTKEAIFSTAQDPQCYVFVRQGSGFPAAGGKSDVSATLSVAGKAGATTCQTSSVTREAAPTWNESFEIPGWRRGDEIDVVVLDHNLGTDDYLGSARLGKDQLCHGQYCCAFDGAVDLFDDGQHGEGKKVQGKIHVRMECVLSESVRQEKRLARLAEAEEAKARTAAAETPIPAAEAPSSAAEAPVQAVEEAAPAEATQGADEAEDLVARAAAVLTSAAPAQLDEACEAAAADSAQGAEDPVARASAVLSSADPARLDEAVAKALAEDPVAEVPATATAPEEEAAAGTEGDALVARAVEVLTSATPEQIEEAVSAALTPPGDVAEASAKHEDCPVEESKTEAPALSEVAEAQAEAAEAKVDAAEAQVEAQLAKAEAEEAQEAAAEQQTYAAAAAAEAAEARAEKAEVKANFAEVKAEFAEDIAEAAEAAASAGGSAPEAAAAGQTSAAGVAGSSLSPAPRMSPTFVQQPLLCTVPNMLWMPQHSNPGQLPGFLL